MIPDRYQSRPVEPTQVEAFLLAEDNLQQVADWWNSLGVRDMNPNWSSAHIEPGQDGRPQLRVPAFWGLNVAVAGDYLVHLGGGKTRAFNTEDFHRSYVSYQPADLSLCSCINAQAYGHAEGDGPMQWDRDCKTCGKPMPEQVIAQAAEMYR